MDSIGSLLSLKCFYFCANLDFVFVRNNIGLQGKGTMVVSTSGSSERFLVFSFVMLLSTPLLYV